MSGLMRDILGVFAGFERQMIAQRTKMGLSRRLIRRSTASLVTSRRD
jgi:DNA invertase Pin-like site-specific DNA recombinase